MFTKKKFAQMSVKRLASAKRVFRITKDNIRKLEDDTRFSDADIERMRDMIVGCDITVNQKIKDMNIFEEDELESDIIKLCQEFQSNFRWTMDDMQEYIGSIIDGQALTAIVFGDIEKIMTSIKDGTAEKTSHESYKFFKKLKDLGYVYVVIDGNNRTTTIGKFYNDEVPLKQSSDFNNGVGYQHPEFERITKSTRYYSQLSTDLREHIDKMMMSITIVESGTLEDLGRDFVKVNSQVKLNDQEMRQANVCEFGRKVRELAEKYDPIFRKKVYEKRSKGKPKLIESALFTDKFIGRRNVEQLIVTISNILTDGTAKVDKRTLDNCYGDKSNFRKSNTEFHRVEKIFGKIMKWRDKYGRNFLDSNGCLQGNIIDLVSLLDYFDKNDYNIKDDKKFINWFGETQTYKNNDISKINPKRQVMIHQCTKGVTDSDGNFQTLRFEDDDGVRTGQISENVIWMDPAGKGFKYSEIQQNLQQNWNLLRLDLIKDSLSSIPDGVVIKKDKERDFPIGWRYLKWVEQDGKTYSTDEEIPLTDLFNTKLYQMDHVIDHADGGLTTLENCHLESSEYNQSGKYKKGFDEITDLFD